MGFFDRQAKRPATTGTDYLPATVDTAVTRAQELGTTLANRAGAVYKQNPKMIKTIASGALLIAAAAFAKKKGYM
ncbi:MAG: hypothetical protein M3R58_13890 [Pseudomonadota bacterium]|nr:hypothetical protein [Pseudomonadota bacterium]